MLLFIANNKSITKYIDHYDAGLLGLTPSLSVQDKVYVVSDPILYLQIQKHVLKDGSEPMPLLCSVPVKDDVFKTAVTTRAWRTFITRR
jgi:hypothetical protein